ncbi:TPA: hypothetical protein N0F65_010663 [Lagenidium giganteum]|uniref:Uncharacterized protein n=1 Tax=Lagenidium giganteum TaxID=4803 RepID=A0AAV2ZDR0_9STRA|nr:TPA: hypothetical protein N0F65_010663 [Lagenidium giganteum]
MLEWPLDVGVMAPFKRRMRTAYSERIRQRQLPVNAVETCLSGKWKRCSACRRRQFNRPSRRLGISSQLAQAR